MSTTTTDPPATGQHLLTRFTAAVHGAVDRVADAGCLSMPRQEAAATVVELTRLQARIEELRLRVLSGADAAEVAELDASASTGAWLAKRTRQRRGAAFADVKLAHALGAEFAATRAALAAGRILTEQARAVVKAVRDLPSTVGPQLRRRAEEHLLEQAQEFDAAALAVLGRHLLEVLDPAEAERRLGKKLTGEERAAARSTFLTLVDNGDGSVSGRFKIPVLTAAMLTKALDALTAPRHTHATGKTKGRVMHPDRHPLGADDWPQQHPQTTSAGAAGAGDPAGGDPGFDRVEQPKLSAAERRGQALCALIERYPAHRLPQVGGLNATVVVTMTLEQLRGELEGACLLDNGAEISAGNARRLACAAKIIPAVLGGDSQVLDLGRGRRSHTPAQRIAMGIRDRGCPRPAWLAEAHHKTLWSHGGGTSVKDGVLLCPWHHHRAHDPRYRIEYLPTGKTRFHRRT